MYKVYLDVKVKKQEDFSNSIKEGQLTAAEGAKVK